MKRMLLASAVALTAGGQALAADLPPPMAPPPRAPAAYIPIAPAYNWTGFYIGGNLGGAFSSGSFNTHSAGTRFNSSNSTIPPSLVAARSASTMSSIMASWSAPRPCSTGRQTPKTLAHLDDSPQRGPVYWQRPIQ